MSVNLVAPITSISQSLMEFRSTGALAPSGPFLAKAMVKELPKPGNMASDFRVLEVGPGTGALTEAIVSHMAGLGHIDLVEINPKFVTLLQKRIQREGSFSGMRERITVHQGDVRELPLMPTYDAIISGLPFNNFSPREVREFLNRFKSLLRTGGTLTYFEYVAVRRLQSPFVGKRHRRRLRHIGRVVRDFADSYQYRQRIVPMNIPPARVRYLRFD